MVLSLSDGKGAESIDRAIKRIEQTPKVETIKERTDIQHGNNLPKGDPQVSSILYMNTDQPGALPCQESQYYGDMLQ